MKYVYGAGALISQESSDGTGYYHYDLRGSTVALTDETGTITDRYQYDVYGQVLHTEGDSTTPFLYNGRDGVMTDGNGLLYMRARYYSPELKRFINADILQGNIGDSDTLNRYAYVEGNPVSMVDPFGLCAEPGSKKKGSKGFLGKIKSGCRTVKRKVKSGYHTVVSGTKKFFSSWSVSDYIHTALDGLGMIPGGGAIFDGINAIYYLTEGDVMNTGMSGIALIPLVSEAAAGGKFATKTADGVGDVIKSSEKIGDAMQDTVKYVDDIADSGKYADDIAGSGKYVDEIIDGGIKSGLNSNLLDELANSGVKYNLEDIVAITKTADGKLVWLENGTDTAGLNHIITEHADDFLNKGITQEQIPDYVMNALENGKIVGYQGRGTGRSIYEFTYNGEIHKVAITVGNNGFIVGANPK